MQNKEALIRVAQEGTLLYTPCILDTDTSLNWDVVPTILDYLPFESLMSCRRISKIWNTAFSFPKSRSRARFIINGDTVESYVTSFKTLQASRIPWCHFKFLLLDMERQALGNRNFFEFFVTKFRNSILTLNFEVCRISLGRFIEIIACCRKTQGISIKNCPYLHTSAFNVLNWKDYLPYFYENIKNMASLQITEDFEDIHSTICTWIGNITKLSSFAISSVSSNISGLDIIRVIYKNRAHLTELHLSGKYDNIILTPQDWQNIASMNLHLQTLSLEALTLALPNSIPEPFRGFSNLKTLIISECKVEKCTYKIFNGSQKISAIKLRYINTVMNNKACASLFRQTRLNLDVLALNIGKARELFYQSVLSNCKHLKDLDLSDSNLDDNVLIDLITKLEKLVSLNLKNTQITCFGLLYLLNQMGGQLQLLDVTHCSKLKLTQLQLNVIHNYTWKKNLKVFCEQFKPETIYWSHDENDSETVTVLAQDKDNELYKTD